MSEDLSKEEFLELLRTHIKVSKQIEQVRAQISAADSSRIGLDNILSDLERQIFHAMDQGIHDRYFSIDGDIYRVHKDQSYGGLYVIGPIEVE